MRISNLFTLKFVIVLLFSIIFETMSIQLIFQNKCSYTVWPGTLTASGKPSLPTTGFTLEPGASSTLAAPPSWSGRIWARTRCSQDGKFVCGTADCGSGQISCNGAGANPPATLVEITLNGAKNQDFYDISLVDGYNLPISVTPTTDQCSSADCAADINQSCPSELQVKDPQKGDTEACKSACLAFNKPEYCCTGDYNTPDKCPPSQYSQFFKQLCPNAYSYAYDDQSSTFTCPSGSTDYTITFCLNKYAHC